MKVQCLVAAVFLCGVNVQGGISEQEAQLLDDSETPNILYIVPWEEVPQQKVQIPKLVIHGLMGDLYDPQIPDDF